MKISLGLTVLAIMLLAVGCGVAIDVEDRTDSRKDTFQVGGSSKLEVSGFNGNIVVRSGPDGEIRVEAKLRKPDGIDYQVTQHGDTVKVEAKKKGVVIGTQPTVNIDVTVPQSTVLDLKTSNGNVEAHGTRRPATLKTSNGKIILEDVEGEFQARTTNGAINVDGLKGSVRLNTSNGSVDFRGILLPGGDNEMATSNGGIAITFEGEPSVRLEASTSNGVIKSELPILATETGKNHLVGTYGDGEADLKVETTNGSITVR